MQEFLVSNVTMFGLNVPSSKDLIVVPSWTLGIELSFYLIAPFILRKSDRFLLVLLMAGLALRLVPYNAHAPVFSGIEYFVMGAFSYRKRHLLEFKGNHTRPVRQGLPFIVMVLLMAFSPPAWDPLAIPMTYNQLNMIIYPALFALLLPSLFAASQGSNFDRAIGEVSYPFYTFHLVIIFALATLPWPSKTLFALAAIIATLLVAFVVLRIESKWIEPIRARLSIPASREGVHEKASALVAGNIPVPAENHRAASA